MKKPVRDKSAGIEDRTLILTCKTEPGNRTTSLFPDMSPPETWYHLCSSKSRVRKEKGGIYAFVYDKLRNFQDAQDMTQEVFENAQSEKLGELYLTKGKYGSDISEVSAFLCKTGCVEYYQIWLEKIDEYSG